MTTIRIPQRFQGPTGMGQGGWSVCRFVEAVGQPATVSIRAPIPTETDLEIVQEGHRHLLVDTSGGLRQVILESEPFHPEFPSTTAVSIDEAAEARTRFPMPGDLHPVPLCFSCGEAPDSMGVQAGPLADGRFAVDWTPPAWAVADDGTVDPATLWAALDCTSAWYVCCDGPFKSGYTVQYAVTVQRPPEAGSTYALVGWNGFAEPGWDGRKRGAASAAFDADGTCIAQTTSLWVSVL